MTPENVTAFALEFTAVTEERPFGPGTTVYKVEGRIFVLLSSRFGTPSVSLKCEPDRAVDLRSRYRAITAGYHLNKRHWNTVLLDDSVPRAELEEMIEHSYDRVIAGLPKATRLRLDRP